MIPSMDYRNAKENPRNTKKIPSYCLKVNNSFDYTLEEIFLSRFFQKVKYINEKTVEDPKEDARFFEGKRNFCKAKFSIEIYACIHKVNDF